MKTLIFEGAGMDWKETGLNHRIRTRIKNNEGRIVYFEMTGSERTKYSTAQSCPFDYTGFVSHCFYDDRPEDSKANYSKELQPVERSKCEYTKEGIIKFINYNLNCSFDDLVIKDDVYVHNTKNAIC